MSESEPSDSIQQRVSGSRLRLLALLRLNRWLFTSAILFVAFCVLVITSQFGLAPFREIVTSQNGLRYLFSPFIGAIITGTSIVVTINQLVLSQELGAIGDQRDRMEGAVQFREDIESKTEKAVSPPEPAAFLYDLVDSIQSQADRFAAAVSTADAATEDTVNEYVDDLTENAEVVKDDLDNTQFGTFDVLWAVLNFNYSWKIYAGRRLQTEYAESLSEEAHDELDELIEQLKFFGPAREHFKTLYFQWELINLSRALLYIAIPALVVTGIMIMYVNANTFYGTTLGVDNLVWVASAGFTVGIAPFVVFTVFILRIATVAKRTLAMGPFILRETSREGMFQ